METWEKGAIATFFIVYICTIIIFLILDPIRVFGGLILGFVSFLISLLPTYVGLSLPLKAYGIIFLCTSFFAMLFPEVVVSIMDFFFGLLR